MSKRFRLTNDEVKDIREKFNSSKYTQTEIAEDFGISGSYVSELVNWKKRTVYKDEVGWYKGHKIYLDGKGYPSIWLGDKNLRVHRLVYKDNFGDIPKGFVVHHKDEDVMNWSPQNLEALSKAEHQALHISGEDHPMSKLTEQEVITIRNLYATEKVTLTELSKMFPTSVSNISDIVNCNTWTHLC